MEQKQGLCCPITGCPIKKVLLWTVVSFAVIFGFEWVFHGIYMMPAYEATAEMWRDEEAMKSLFHITLISTFFKALTISGLFGFASCNGGGVVKGLKFGLLVGLLMGGMEFGSYAYMPIPFDMAIKWLVGGVLTGILVGAALGLCNCSAACKKEG